MRGLVGASSVGLYLLLALLCSPTPCTHDSLRLGLGAPSLAPPPAPSPFPPAPLIQTISTTVTQVRTVAGANVTFEFTNGAGVVVVKEFITEYVVGITGAEIVQFYPLTPVDGQPGMVVGRASLALEFKSNTATFKVLDGVVQDVLGNSNQASEEVRWAMGSEHETTNAFTLANSTTPSGATICLTPADLIEYRGVCGIYGTEEYPRYDMCLIRGFSVNYTEVNNGGWPVGEGAYNTWYYDGVPTKNDTFDQPIPSHGRRETSLMLNYGLDGRGVERTDWGVIDGEEHTLALYLDTESYNILGGEIKVRYCGFQGNNTLPALQPCSCIPELKSGPGVYVGNALWTWGSKENCVNPDSAVVRNGVRGVVMLFDEIETTHMYGENAEKLRFTSANNFTSTLTISLLQSPTVPEISETLSTKSLAPGQTVRNSVFVPLPETDRKVRRLELRVDVGNDVLERDERNRYSVEFEMCWPPDIVAISSLTLNSGLGNGLPGERTGSIIEVPWGGELCVTPDHLQASMNNGNQTVFLSEENALFSFSYTEFNGGNVMASNWVSRFLWDGVRVVDVQRGPLQAGESTLVTVTIDLGIPDHKTHELRLCLDCDDEVKEYGFEDELAFAENPEANNLKAPIQVSFCGFGVDMNTGTGMQVGLEYVRWDGNICLMDVDFQATETKLCNENGCTFVASNATDEVPTTYMEVNLGPQTAMARYTGALGWSNTFLKDETEELMVQGFRQPLAAGANRSVEALISDQYKTKQISFGTPDEFKHKLTLHLDSYNDIPWNLNQVDRWNMSLYFCTSDLIAAHRCGCPSDLVVTNGLTIGTQFVLWGDQVCLKAEDLERVKTTDSEAQLQYFGVNITYSVQNIGPHPARGVPGFRNILSYDDLDLVADDVGEHLYPGESLQRSLPWQYDYQLLQTTGLSVSRDNRRHKISVRLDAMNTIGEINEENEWSIWLYFASEYPDGCPRAPPPPPPNAPPLLPPPTPPNSLSPPSESSVPPSPPSSPPSAPPPMALPPPPRPPPLPCLLSGSEGGSITQEGPLDLCTPPPPIPSLPRSPQPFPLSPPNQPQAPGSPPLLPPIPPSPPPSPQPPPLPPSPPPSPPPPSPPPTPPSPPSPPPSPPSPPPIPHPPPGLPSPAPPYVPTSPPPAWFWKYVPLPPRPIGPPALPRMPLAPKQPPLPPPPLPFPPLLPPPPSPPSPPVPGVPLTPPTPTLPPGSPPPPFSPQSPTCTALCSSDLLSRRTFDCQCVTPYRFRLTFSDVDIAKFDSSQLVEDLSSALDVGRDQVILRLVVTGSVIVEVDILPLSENTFSESELSQMQALIVNGDLNLIGGAEYDYEPLVPAGKVANKEQGLFIESITQIVISIMAVGVLAIAFILYARQKKWICNTAVLSDEEADSQFNASLTAPPPLPGSLEYVQLIAEKHEQLKMEQADTLGGRGGGRRPFRTRTVDIIDTGVDAPY